MMDNLLTKGREVEADIESGVTTNGEERASCFVLTNNLNRSFSDRAGNTDLLVDKNSGGEGSQNYRATADNEPMEDKQKRKNSWKPPKPPRPPKGPLLDAADQKLVREIAELAMRRRARIERIKALKKTRSSKSSSSNNSLSATIITVLFFLIIFFQGISSKGGGNMLSQGSPAPTVAASEDFIAIQLFRNFSAYGGRGPGPGYNYPILANEQASVLGLRK